MCKQVKYLIIICFGFLGGFLKASQVVRIIPAVQQMKVDNGNFVLNKHIAISYKGNLSNELLLLQTYFKEDFKVSSKVVKKDGDIELVLDTTLNISSKEGYQLKVNNHKIQIMAIAPTGIFYT